MFELIFSFRKKEFSNILLIAEILFTLPVGAVECERSLNTMKRLKVK